MSSLRDFRQSLVVDWLNRTASEVFLHPMGQRERALRVLEECLEYTQAAGIGPVEIGIVLDRVYSRPTGDPRKELGQLQICILAAAEANNISADFCEGWELRELLRQPIPDRIQRMRQKVLDMPSLYDAREIAAAGKDIKP